MTMEVMKERTTASSKKRQREFVALNGWVSNVQPQNRDGKVWLIGAGPGDPELLTRKAEHILGIADVVVHDRLVGAGVLELAAPTARRLYVGKRKSCHSVSKNGIVFIS